MLMLLPHTYSLFVGCAVQVLTQDTQELLHASAVSSVVYTGSNPENKKVVCFTAKSTVSTNE